MTSHKFANKHKVNPMQVKVAHYWMHPQCAHPKMNMSRSLAPAKTCIRVSQNRAICAQQLTKQESSIYDAGVHFAIKCSELRLCCYCASRRLLRSYVVLELLLQRVLYWQVFSSYYLVLWASLQASLQPCLPKPRPFAKSRSQQATSTVQKTPSTLAGTVREVFAAAADL